jgi:divalent metal cation (Fe/Co/Zn/Cd) transporter
MVTVLIVYTGFGIFKEAIFMLSDGFNETELEAYRNDILEVDEVQEVKSIKGL